MKPITELLREYDRARAYTDQLWRDLTPDEVVWRPREDFSAIGWHLGHQAHVAHFMVRNLTAAEPSPVNICFVGVHRSCVRGPVRSSPDIERGDRQWRAWGPPRA